MSALYAAFFECLLAAMDEDYEGLWWWERVTKRYRERWGELAL